MNLDRRGAHGQHWQASVFPCVSAANQNIDAIAPNEVRDVSMCKMRYFPNVIAASSQALPNGTFYFWRREVAIHLKLSAVMPARTRHRSATRSGAL